MSRKLTHADVAEHTDRHNLWMIIHENVLDLCQFIKEHPGGEEVLMDQAGKDASAAFDDVGHSPEARDILKTLTIGVLEKQNGREALEIVPVKPPIQTHNSVTLIWMICLLLAAGAAYCLT